MGMVEVHALRDKQQTGDEMARLVREFSPDLQRFTTRKGRPLVSLPLHEFYVTIRDIPYQVDRTGVEIVTRPWHALTSEWPGLDCKKKAIIIASYLRENGIPWRFVAVSTRPDGRIHHVITEGKIGGRWTEMDATYPHNELGQYRNWTGRELLSGSKGEWAESPVLVSMYGAGDPDAVSDAQFDTVRRRLRGVSAVELGAAASAGTVVGIIVAIVGACAGVASIIVSAVQSNRQEERAHAFQAQQVLDARAYQDKQIAAANATAEEERKRQEELLVKFVLPASLAAGGLLLYRQRRAA